MKPFSMKLKDSVTIYFLGIVENNAIDSKSQTLILFYHFKHVLYKMQKRNQDTSERRRWSALRQ